MKKTIYKLCLEFLVVAILLPLVFALPVAADDALPEVHLMHYEDDFSGTTMDERIVLEGASTYGDGKLNGHSSSGKKFSVYLNRDKSPATGNIVMEFTMTQSGLMSTSGQVQMFGYSGTGTHAIDLRWRNINASSQDFYVYGASTNTSEVMPGDTSEIKVAVQYNTVNGAVSAWLNDVKVVSDSTAHAKNIAKDIARIDFNTNTAMSLNLEDFKWYIGEYEEMPKVLSQISREDFETDRDAVSEVPVTYGNAKWTSVRNEQKQGVLKATTTASGGEYVWDIGLQDSGAALEGDYLFETILVNPTGSTNFQRFTFLTGSMTSPSELLYVYWGSNGSDGLGVRNFRASSQFTDLTSNMADYGVSDKKTMKVTARFNSETGDAKIWINDHEAWSYNFGENSANAKICGIRMNAYNGSIGLADLFCYRPVPRQLTDDEKLAKGLEKLTDDKVFYGPLTASGYLVDDLCELPTLVADEVDVEWALSANAQDYIDLETGYVTQGEEEIEASLTATLSVGSASTTKTYNFKIPALGASVDGNPSVMTMAYREEFNEPNPDRIVTRDGAVGRVAIENGVLSMSTSSASGSATNANIYLKEDKSEVKGEFAVDFVVEKGATCEGPQMVLTNEAGTWMTDIRWYSNNMVRLLYYNASGVREMVDCSAADFDISGRVKLTIQADTEAGLVSLFINNKPAVLNKPMKTEGITKMMFTKDSQVFTTKIDHFRFYYTKTEDSRAARLDAGDLTYNSIFGPSEITDGVIAYDVTLPTRGMRGSTITWTSSDEDIISNEGVLTRPEADTQVTMTATVVSGDSTETVTFNVTALRGGDGDLVILRKDYDAVTLESILTGALTGDDLIQDDLDLYTEGAYGSTISWATTNAELIAADGSVTRPLNQEGNIYATLTATITNGDYSLEKKFRLGVVPMDYDFSQVPVPERYESIHRASFEVHTTGEPYNSEETSLVDYKIDDVGTARGFGGRITEFNGYVEMIRERNTERASTFSYPFRPSGQSIGDLAVTQFTLEKTQGTGEVKMQIDGDNTVAILFWQSDGKFHLRHRDGNYTLHDVYSQNTYTGQVTVTFMTDQKSNSMGLWINNDCIAYGADVQPYSYTETKPAALKSIGFSIEGTNYVTLKIGEFDTYYAYPVAHQRPENDFVWLTEALIRDGVPAPATGKLAADLNLVTEGKYGSTITWASTDESLIATDGTVNRPPEWPNEAEVTITATISYGCFSAIKEFTFNVMPVYSEDEKVAEKDEAFLDTANWNFFMFDDTDFDSVKYSLNLPDMGPYGSTYIWKTTNPKVITESGRVTRPRWGEEPVEVTMTALIMYGTALKTKEFTFTVQPDEMLADPNHMSDEDFFGVWDGSTWTTVGKINYSYGRNLGAVEAAAKAGDYALAKEELLKYMKNRPASFLSQKISRNPSYAENFIVSGFADSENHNHFTTATTIDSHEYQTYGISLGTSVVAGGRTTYEVAARYNEKSTVRVISTEHPNADMRPYVELVVNGAKMVFTATGDTTVRGGQYSYDNFSTETEMPITYFGAFQGDGLSNLLLDFDFSSISKNDVVTNATLYLTAKIDEAYAPNKELVIFREGTDWADASTVTFRNMIEYAHNFNGIPGGNTWRGVTSDESEYVWQMVRFRNHATAAAEYAYTGDEKYAYKVIYDLLDYIIDTQGRFVYSTEVNAGRVPSSSDWEVLPSVVRYGAYPRALDMSLKLDSIIDMFDVLAKSPYMTPDACSAILKNFWHGANELDIFLYDPANAGLGANQKIMEAKYYAEAAMYMPEFYNSSFLVERAIDIMEELMTNSFFPDGAYIESSDGYTSIALDDFISFWQTIRTVGYDYSPAAKDLLSKATMYVANLSSNGGVSIAWGDNGKSRTRITAKRQDYYALTGDEEINFVNTYGRAGIMPDFTSKLYESSMVAMLRSDWTDDGTFVFIPSGGMPSHAHFDSNHIILNAYKKALLIDPGYFSYDSSPGRVYAKSTLGHNTVEIDSTNQRVASGGSAHDLVPLATKNSWVSNDNYDFYSVTSHANKAQAVDPVNKSVDHRRTITFLKPNIVIVSDRMSPDMNDPAEAAKPHSYKQLWHMSALAALDGDEDKRQFFSNFEAGAQLKIASADTDATMHEAIGIDTEQWGVGSDAPYGYYQKENIVGPETFDTVLMPYPTSGDVVAEHISLGNDVDNADATAMKITYTLEDETDTIYYLLDYNHTTGDVHTFGNYTTDAELAVIRENEEGEIVESIFYNGSYVKTTDNETVLSAGSAVESLSFVIDGDSVEMNASSDVTRTEIEAAISAEVKNVLYNKVAAEFELTDGTLGLTGADSSLNVENDPSGDKGGVSAGGGAGGAGGAGGGGGAGGTDKPEQPGGTDEPGDVVQPEQPGGNVSDVTFNDVDNHWAEESIARMASMGVVQGDNGNFRPDDSISRAELVTMVARVLKLDLGATDTGFGDVAKDSWYAQYVKAALDLGIISKSDTFRPNDAITREEMSKILAVASALASGKDLEVPKDFEMDYEDAHAVSEWAKPFVAFASHSGLMNGMDGGNFAPKASATRAQVATVLDRIFSTKK